MKKCAHDSCWHLFNLSHYRQYCSEYCFLLRDNVILNGKWPVMQRNCNWCGNEYDYRHGKRQRNDSFCGLPCSREAQRIRRFYAIANILRLNEDGLTAKDIAPLGEIHGCPMSSTKAAMRLRSLVAHKVATFEISESSPHPIRLYFLNPIHRGKPFKESLQCLIKIKDARANLK